MDIRDVVTNTPIHKITSLYNSSNDIYIKRDDLQPFSFGGNKVRIGQKIIQDAIAKGCDTVIISGSRRSNLCRVTSNLAHMAGIECHMISIIEEDLGCDNAFNGRFCEMFGANIVRCYNAEKPKVAAELKEKLDKEGKKIYYMNDWDAVMAECTAYRDAYKEIEDYQKQTGIFFDYIFHASGSTTTQCGLIIGKLLSPDYGKEGCPDPKIVGISIGREKARGYEVLGERVHSYFERNPHDKLAEGSIEKEIEFYADILCGGYANYTPEIAENCDKMLRVNGFEVDTTYTGKAYTGMEHYLAENGIENKKVLFIHTGGLPLYFDHLNDTVNAGK